MNPPTITFISFGNFEKGLLEEIAEVVKDEFGCIIELKEAHFDLSDFYDPGRRQYNGDKLIRAIDAMQMPGSAKVIGLFNVDLFIPILTYIFGQAQLGGRIAIASLHRLSNESYGIMAGNNSLPDRFKKEVIHELGHTFGLIHCHTPTCVMRSSTYVEDIDQKDSHLCSNCRLLIGKS